MPIMWWAGTASSQRPGPPSAVWVLSMEARSVAAERRAPFGVSGVPEGVLMSGLTGAGLPQKWWCSRCASTGLAGSTTSGGVVPRKHSRRSG